ncbi:ImmA/IrrE family metallo-endopeptidase [Acinetobacter rudis]|uniref:ImmA/IrrE family metallo-endopeptidase n=1 Tax=Acinetobacter rudis TaxID=632955 RepID=UPI00333F63AA
MSDLNFRLDMLEWAAGNIHLSLSDIVSKISESEKTQEKLLAGYFSVKQAEKFAEITKVPFGTLFLPSPPVEVYRPSIPDLRQKQNPEPLSDFFYEVLSDIKNKQGWFIDYLKDQDAPQLEFVAKYSDEADLDYKIVSADIRQTINLPILSTNKTTRDNYLNDMIDRCEKVGILVFKNGVVKNASIKTLDVNEFRGFVLIDRLAPVIFLNGRDAPSALIFTLAHELAHIWLGQSGVDDLDLYGNDPTEVLCNKIAADVLVPEVDFLSAWRRYDGNITEMADYFCVSRLMLFRVALTHGKVTNMDYQIFHDAELRASRDNSGSGGNFFNMVRPRNSKKLTNLVVNEALSGNLLLRDAGRILNVSPQNIMKLGGV